MFSNIWTEKVSLDVKQKFWNVVKAIEKADVSKNHVFNIREPKNCLKIWDTMPKDLILDKSLLDGLIIQKNTRSLKT